MIQYNREAYALITGGGHGIGAEFADLLAAEGWNIIITGRNEENLQQTASALASRHGVRAEVKVHDLSDPEQAHELHRRCEAEGLRVEILINNAGFGLFGRAYEQDLKEVEGMLQLNIVSLTALSTLFAADMKARGSGGLLNIGSLAGRSPMPNFAAYGASKGYVRSFSVALNAELAGSGVHCSCLEPGYVRTDFDTNARIHSARYRAFSRKHGMEPREVARAGVKALKRGKAVAIPGITNRLIAWFSGIVSEPLAAFVIGRGVRALSSDVQAG